MMGTPSTRNGKNWARKGHLCLFKIAPTGKIQNLSPLQRFLSRVPLIETHLTAPALYSISKLPRRLFHNECIEKQLFIKFDALKYLNQHQNISFIQLVSETDRYHQNSGPPPLESTMASPAKADILLLSLAMQPFLDDSYSALINQISSKANIKRAKSASGALNFLSAQTPRAILATDEGLTKPSNGPVLEKVLSYVRNGGLLLIGLHFPNFTNMDVFDKFFGDLGLPWKHGDYHRTTFQFNGGCTLPDGMSRMKFPGSYSMKVLHVKGARAHEKIFVPVPQATTQSMVFPPEYVDQAQAAIVGAKIGEGYLVYDGNVNPEEGQNRVVLTLCGL